jgi:hypothetical protein
MDSRPNPLEGCSERELVRRDDHTVVEAEPTPLGVHDAITGLPTVVQGSPG